MGKLTINKPETRKSVCTLPALPDGGFALSLKHSEEGRLHMQTGIDGRIFFNFTKYCIQKVCSISLVREILRVSWPLFWTCSSSKNFYEITQNSNFNVASPEHFDYNLLGRHAVDKPYNRRNVNGQGHSNLPSSTTRVCTELKEISLDTYTENRFLRGDSRFINHDLVFTTEESVRSSEAVSRASSETQMSILELTKLRPIQLFKQYFQHK